MVVTFPPQPDNLVKITESFSLSGNVEIAEWSTWWELTAEPGSPADWRTALQALAGGAHAAMEGFTTSGFSPALELVFSKASLYGTDGKVKDEQVHAASPGDWSPSSGDSLPWSSALVVGLYTYTPGSFIPHSARRRGRVFLGPLSTSAIRAGESGELGTGLQTTIMNAFSTYLHAIAGTGLGGAWGPPVPGVLSRVAGQFNHITDLVVDDRLDTQRSRTRSEPAVKDTVAY